MEMIHSSTISARAEESPQMDSLQCENSEFYSFVEHKTPPDNAPTVVLIPELSSIDRSPSPLSCYLTHDQNGAERRTIHPPLRNSAWDTSGVNWSKSCTGTSLSTDKAWRKHSSISLSSSSSSSSDEESSRESVDLEEEHQRSLREEQHRTQGNTTGTTGLGADGTARRPVYGMTIATTQLYPRQRSVTETSDTPFGVEAGGGVTNTFRRASDRNDTLRPFRSASGFLIRNQRTVTNHSRRNLLILFLVAVYTTFGLTTPNLPQEKDLIFPDTTVPVVEVLLVKDSSADFYNTESSSDQANLRGFRASDTSSVIQSPVAGGGGKSKLSFARRNNRQMLTFRKKEITDFYHQKALQDETSNLSWYYYVNCFVLVVIFLWACRERSIAARGSSGTDHSQSQQQSVPLLN